MGVNHPPRTNSLVNDFLIWFIMLGLFQAIVMLRVNRKAWLIIVVSVLAGTIASVPLLYPRLLFGKPIWTWIMGTMVQAFGTCLLFLYFMAHPRADGVPKCDRNRLELAASRSEPLVRFQQERLGVVPHGVLCDHVRIAVTAVRRALEGERW